MKSLNNPYLTIINTSNKFNPETLAGFEYDEVPIKMGDWGKKTALIERQTHLAYNNAVKELQDIGATCTLNSAGRTKIDQVYAKIEKFCAVLKKSKSIKIALKDTKTLTAKLGYSEHLSTLAIDVSINMDNVQIPEKIIKRYPDASLPELKFLTRRLIMEKNGFILSYPQDDRLKEVTGITKPEGWHWRYVGPEHSQMIAKIREKTSAELGEKYEVFLEDYVQLLNSVTTTLPEEELVDKYCELFKSNILKINNSTLTS